MSTPRHPRLTAVSNALLSLGVAHTKKAGEGEDKNSGTTSPAPAPAATTTDNPGQLNNVNTNAPTNPAGNDAQVANVDNGAPTNTNTTSDDAVKSAAARLLGKSASVAPAVVPPVAAPAATSVAPAVKSAADAGFEALSSEQLTKLAFELGHLMLSTEEHRKIASQIISRAEGQTIAAGLIKSASEHNGNVNAHLKAAAEAQARQVEEHTKLATAWQAWNKDVDALPAPEAELVRKQASVHAACFSRMDQEFASAMAAAGITSDDHIKSASEEDKAAIADRFQLHELRKVAHANGAADMEALAGQLPPEAGPEAVAGAEMPGMPAEEAPPSPEEILALIDQLVAEGQIPPEQGEQLKAEIMGQAGIADPNAAPLPPEEAMAEKAAALVNSLGAA